MSGRRRRPGRRAGMRLIQLWVRAGSPLDRLLQPRGLRGPRWGRYLHLFLEQHLELLQAFLAQQGIPAQLPGGTAEEAPAGRRPAFSGAAPLSAPPPPPEDAAAISEEELRRAARQVWDWGGR
jgi:hypothetical protein